MVFLSTLYCSDIKKITTVVCMHASIFATSVFCLLSSVFYFLSSIFCLLSSSSSVGSLALPCKPTVPCQGDQSCVQKFYSANGSIDICQCPFEDDILDDSFSCHNGSAWCAGHTRNGLCGCPAGYSLQPNESRCVDMNECQVEAPLNVNVTCVNTPGQFYGWCPSGYTFNTWYCQQIDWCQSNPCQHSLATCVNVGPSYQCFCGLHHCHTNASCTGKIGSYACSCNTGFTGDGKACTDLNECSGGASVCHPDAACFNTIGSYGCLCNDGHAYNGVRCCKANEIVLGHGTCYCKIGFHFSLTGCKDEDECRFQALCPFNSKCQNVDGSFNCLCAGGLNYSSSCHACGTMCGNQICLNNSLCIGNSSCSCKSGYSRYATSLSGSCHSCDYIDECNQQTNGRHRCHTNATCTDTIGSYTCSCNTGFTGNGKACTDWNECSGRASVCHPDAACFNTIGSYGCLCNDGREYNGVRCCEANEIVLAPGKCVCKTGYSLSSTGCKDDDECSVLYKPRCPFNSKCQNVDGSFNCLCAGGLNYSSSCHACGTMCGNQICLNNSLCIGNSSCSCKSGYSRYATSLSGSCHSCDYIDECNQQTNGRHRCHTNATCTDTIGSYTCSCNTGFTGNGKACTDLNECSGGAHGCHPDATCFNTIGSYRCFCKDGFVGNGSQCFDIDECLNSSACHSNASCSNVNGSYSCECNIGYSGDGKHCDNEDECNEQYTTKYQCHSNATCTDTIGSYICSCNTGFTGNGEACTDLNECSGRASVCHPDAACFNTIGSYGCLCNDGREYNGVHCCEVNEMVFAHGICVCKTGYLYTFAGCEDNDECSVRYMTPCPVNSKCQNVDGSFNCLCAGGLNYIGSCDACGTMCGNQICLNNSLCMGNSSCSCKSGYSRYATSLSGSCHSCDYIDECNQQTNGTHRCHTNATCTDTIGSYTCSCNTGFTGNGKACTDSNECSGGASVCHPDATCFNTIGNYRCFCKDGFVGNGSQCFDIDECLNSSACHSNASCSNVNGSYSCECNIGYSGDGKHCDNEDECNEQYTTKYPCHSNATCTDTIGSYTCSCNTGFTGNGKACTDWNECSGGAHGCHPDATCFNTIGSYRCFCKDGFVGNGSQCFDIDECLNSSACHSNASCSNVIGSYSCECNIGYSGDGKHCDNEDECNEQYTTKYQCHSNATCTDTIGSYICSCNTGFTGNGKACTDLNECSGGAHGCHPDATCFNTIGSYRCFCKDGFSGNGMQCFDIDECLNSSACHSNAKCSNIDGSYKCSCLGGFAGGQTSVHGCINIDECEQLDSACDSQATCADTAGSYTCTCNSGFTGDGTVCWDLKSCKWFTPCIKCTVIFKDRAKKMYSADFIISQRSTLQSQGSYQCRELSYKFSLFEDCLHRHGTLSNDKVFVVNTVI